MKTSLATLFGVLALVASADCPLARAQETVVVSKARLEELERKEAELEKLKRELQQPGREPVQLHLEPVKAEAASNELPTTKAGQPHSKAVTPPPATPNPPALATLPPLTEGQVVDARDLVNHYRADPVASARRYQSIRIRVAGEFTSFDKPMFVQHAWLIMATAESGWSVMCRLEPPANVTSLFTTKHGEELVGASSTGVRTVLARVRQPIIVEGWCKGLKEQGVILSGIKLVSAP